MKKLKTFQTQKWVNNYRMDVLHVPTSKFINFLNIVSFIFTEKTRIIANKQSNFRRVRPSCNATRECGVNVCDFQGHGPAGDDVGDVSGDDNVVEMT